MEYHPEDEVDIHDDFIMSFKGHLLVMTGGFPGNIVKKLVTVSSLDISHVIFPFSAMALQEGRPSSDDHTLLLRQHPTIQSSAARTIYEVEDRGGREHGNIQSRGISRE